MKKSDGSTLTSLPVSDSSTGTTRTVSGEVILSEVKIMCQYKFYIYICVSNCIVLSNCSTFFFFFLPSKPFYVGIKGTMSSETVTREDQKVVTPVGGQIDFVPPFGRQVLFYKEKIKKKIEDFVWCLMNQNIQSYLYHTAFEVVDRNYR